MCVQTINCDNRSIREGVADILGIYFSVIDIMPKDAVRQILIDAIEMGLEIAEGVEVPSLKKNLHYVKMVNNEGLLSFYTELILRINKLPRLFGFGFSTKFGDSVSGDPERTSYLNRR